MMPNNPFADFGTQLCGERFIGRSDELRMLESRVFGPSGYGSAVVIGLPRIGKSSLVLEAARRAAVTLDEKRLVVVRIELGEFSSVDDMFRCLAKELLDGIRERGWSSPLIEARASMMVAEAPLWDGFRGLLRAVRLVNIRPVFILDEFDAARYVFAGVPQSFHWLRGLCSDPDYKVAVIMVSKRRLQDVARIAGQNSDYWANVLMTIPLRSFSDDDFLTFLTRLREVGMVIDDLMRKEITAVCGKHPFLLDVFSYHAWEQARKGQPLSLEWFRSTIGGSIRDYFQQIASILQDGPMLSQAVQVIAGPNWNVTPDDIDSLVQYGVLDYAESNKIRGFSERFEDYLCFLQNSVDIWPLWRDTERLVRDGLETLLMEKLGQSWAVEMKKIRPKVRPLLDACEEKMAKEQARFGKRAAPSILAYTYPMELFQIMAVDWPTYGEPLLGSDKQGWSSKFGLLSKVRTPLAHNREDSVNEAERIQAEGICREILSRIEAWKIVHS